MGAACCRSPLVYSHSGILSVTGARWIPVSLLVDDGEASLALGNREYSFDENGICVVSGHTVADVDDPTLLAAPSGVDATKSIGRISLGRFTADSIRRIPFGYTHKNGDDLVKSLEPYFSADTYDSTGLPPRFANWDSNKFNVDKVVLKVDEYAW